MSFWKSLNWWHLPMNGTGLTALVRLQKMVILHASVEMLFDFLWQMLLSFLTNVCKLCVCCLHFMHIWPGTMASLLLYSVCRRFQSSVSSVVVILAASGLTYTAFHYLQLCVSSGTVCRVTSPHFMLAVCWKWLETDVFPIPVLHNYFHPVVQ